MPDFSQNPIIVPLSDGRALRLPPGTAPEVVERARVEYEARLKGRLGGPPVTTVVEQGPEDPELTLDPARRSTPEGAVATSVPGRAVAGMVLDRLDPATELAARAADALGAPPSVLRGVQERNAARLEDYRRARVAAGQSGADMPRMLGAAVPDVLATKGLGLATKSRALTAPVTLPELVMAGGVAGGVGATLGPVSGSKDLDNTQYLLQKLVQGSAGAAVGAAAAPFFAGLTELMLAGGDKAAQAMRTWFSKNQAQQLAANPAALETYLAAEAAAAGVNWAAVPEEMRRSLSDAAKRATLVTGQLPAAAVRNRLLAERLNLPQLTVGQATRDPVTFSREANNPNVDLRNLFNQQHAAVTDRLNQTASGFGPARTMAETGALIADDLMAQAEARHAAVNDLYTTARSTEGRRATIQNISDLAKETLTDLKQRDLILGNNGLAAVSPGMLRTMQTLAAPGATQKITIEQAVRALQDINAKLDVADNPALATVKRRLQAFLDNRAQFTDQAEGSAAVAAYKAARAGRAEMGRWQEGAKALSDITDRRRGLANDVVFDRILRSPVDEFSHVWSTMSDASQEAFRRKFVERLTGLALGRSGSDASNYSLALKYLRDLPQEKLDKMFPANRIDELRAVLEYARLTREAPAGNFVNRSGTALALLDALSGVQNVPRGGGTPAWLTGLVQFGAKPARAFRDQVGAAAARSGALRGDLEGPEPVLSGDFMTRLVRQMSPYAPVPLGQVMLGMQDRGP